MEAGLKAFRQAGRFLRPIRGLSSLWATSFNARTGWSQIIFLIVTLALAGCLCSIPLAIIVSYSRVYSEIDEREADNLDEAVVSSSEESKTVDLAGIGELNDGSSGCCSVVMGVAMVGDDGTLAPADCSTSKATSATIQQATNPGTILILRVKADGSENQERDEYVEFRNDSGQPLQLQGWWLTNGAGHRFNFSDFVMEAGQACRVYTNEYHRDWCGFNYGSGREVWDNSGGCATIYDEAGAEVARYCY